MSDALVRTCPGCGQALRFPPDVGGVLMACPECGHRFASPFRLAGNAKKSTPQVLPAAPPLQPSPPPATLPPVKNTTPAARAAAKYAANS
ncbi:hypothetical protein [Solidesulfovibrio magneticus]|uniref:Zinc finger/thioredoxin putative domain-containing protein n=1 Tax=Solidesulfovibrio magneticus (strain ATCC 700980 / DSM 13731 / RS-1) TaxID=573370 RepID=C4XQ53_SOLM1|nr:hypothetical protein [Solidesulfovibrio magneticus]BAH75218.1 hypothetical protein DMR_17270 [Solidesulfovibrio magneticus RS-1]